MRCTVTVEGRMPSLNDYISAERANRYKAAAMKKRETARVRAGVIKDGSRKYVEQCPDRVLTDRARPRVVVEVSDE